MSLYVPLIHGSNRLGTQTSTAVKPGTSPGTTKKANPPHITPSRNSSPVRAVTAPSSSNPASHLSTLLKMSAYPRNGGGGRT